MQIAIKRRKAPLDKAVNFLKILKKEYREEYQIKRANDGELRTIFSIAELELSLNEEPIKVIGVIQDITERKKSEQELLKAKERAEESEQRLQMKNEEYETINEELRQTNEELLFAKERAEESEMLLRHIADNVADSVVFRLVADNNGYRKFVFISNNVRQMYGFEPQEVIDNAQLLYSRIFKDDVEKLAAEEIIAISNQKVLRAEIRFVNNNNEVRWAYVVSCPHQYKGMVYWDGILIDITSQKNNEQELKKAIDLAELKEIELHKKNKEYEAINEELTQTNRELFIAKEKAEKNEEILKEAQALAHIGNWELNLENNKLFWSDEIYKIFDCNQQEFTATCESVVDFIHPDDREMVNQAFLDHIAMKKTYEITHRILLKSGNIKYINDRCKTYYNENGKPTKSVGTISDITNQITITNQLREAKEKAEEGDKLKTAFLQNMSHEIRTPMNAIVGFSALLCDEGLTDEKRKSFTTIIQNSSNQLLSIVSDILTISSVETKQAKVTKQKVHLNDMLFELLSIFKIQAENKNISIYSKQQLTDNQSLIYTDKTKLNQILTNLLTNALKFTHEGFIEFGYTIVSGELEFYVKDTGIGIKSDVQEKIFERFRQANTSIEKRYGGTGLGLAISKAFVELLGGKIHVESELGKGSVFYFTIPFMPVENQIIEVGELQKTKKHRFLVLVAEDEEYNFLLINELLKSFPVDVIHAKDGQEAVEFCKSNKNINLILMDIRMPKMNGYEATMIIKELNSNIPIIAQTAYSSENETDMFKQKGFEDCITKPINQSKFNMLIEKYMKNFQVN